MAGNSERIASRIKTARQLSGLTQEEAAAKLNVSARTYIRWEHGESEGFMSRLDGIASIFGTTSEELVGDQGALLADLLAEVRTLSEKVDALSEDD